MLGELSGERKTPLGLLPEDILSFLCRRHVLFGFFHGVLLVQGSKEALIPDDTNWLKFSHPFVAL